MHMIIVTELGYFKSANVTPCSVRCIGYMNMIYLKEAQNIWSTIFSMKTSYRVVIMPENE